MQKSDLKDIPLAQLKTMLKELQEVIKEKETVEREAALEAARKVAQEMGFNLDEIHGSGPKKSGQTAYVNPNNPEQTWAGKGRRPKWLNDLVKQGADIETFRSKD